MNPASGINPEDVGDEPRRYKIKIVEIDGKKKGGGVSPSPHGVGDKTRNVGDEPRRYNVPDATVESRA